MRPQGAVNASTLHTHKNAKIQARPCGPLSAAIHAELVALAREQRLKRPLALGV